MLISEPAQDLKHRQTRPVHKPKGSEAFDLSGYASGTYILVFYRKGKLIAQKIIVKK